MKATPLIAPLLLLGLLASNSHSQAYFEPLDNIEGDWVNRNPVPVRPMVSPNNGFIFAVNPMLNQIAKVDVPNAEVDATYRTLAGPVAIARYDTGDGWQLMVACQLSNAVAIHDEDTGDIVRVIRTPAQPVDVVVDQVNDTLWVSCQGEHALLEVDLTDDSERIYPLGYDPDGAYTGGVMFPCFLTVLTQAEVLSDPPDSGPDPYGGVRVLVSARLSGNGSMVDRKPKPTEQDNAPTLTFDEHAGPLGIRDTLDTDVADPGDGLPDLDLFWADPSSSPPTLYPVASSVGTLLFASAVRPNTSSSSTAGIVWQLNTEANNKDAGRQTEPSILGDFFSNRITKITLPRLLLGQAPASVFTPTSDPRDPSYTNSNSDDIRLLDDISTASGIQLPDPEVSTDLAKMVGTPYALAFHYYSSTLTLGFVAGLLTDNVVAFNGHGTRTGTPIALSSGFMPRQVLVDSSGATLAVWGSGGATTADYRIAIVPLSTGTPSYVSIGFDPTPANIRRGRATFFDASHSLYNNVSCASCHDEGKSDFLAWNLSSIGLGADPDDPTDDDGLDDKGPMVTQTLSGIETVVPFHWRGEQQAAFRGEPALLDFNDAFENLLGGDPLDTENGEFDDFQAFLLSLTEEVNPSQDRTRVLNDDIQPPGFEEDQASAVNGQLVFHGLDDDSTPGNCVLCHALPKGTSNEVMDNAFGGERLTKRLSLKAMPLHNIWNKLAQPTVEISLLSGQEDVDPQVYPLLGVGFSHAGTVARSIDFLLTMLGAPRPQSDRDDVASFLYQFDSGLAPATTEVEFFDEDNDDTMEATLNGYLLDQAGQDGPERRWCDVAIIGRTSTGSVSGWVYDRDNDDFIAEDGTHEDIDFFVDAAGESGAWFAAIGLPLGTGQGFAIDFDRDTVLNADESSAANEFVFAAPADDSTNPGFVAAPDFQWFTTRVARLTFETTELTTAVLTLTPDTASASAGATTIVVESPDLRRVHGMVPLRLEPGMTYDVSLEVTDAYDDSTTYDDSGTWQLTAADRSQRQVNLDGVVVADLDGSVTASGDDYLFTVTGVVNERLTLPVTPVDTAYLVVARILLDGVPDDASSSAFVTLTSPPNPIDTFYVLQEGATAEETGIAGPFVTDITGQTSQSEGDGEFTIKFQLDGDALDTVSEITFSLEAVGPDVNIGSFAIMTGQPVMDQFLEDAETLEFVASYWFLPDTHPDDRKLVFPVASGVPQDP